MVKIKENIASSSNFGPARDIKNIKYIVIHYTANDGDTDEANANYFKTGGRNASAHYFVDDNSITRSVKDNYVAWSVGGSKYPNCASTGGGKFYGKCTNNNSISIEMCDTKKDGKHNVSTKTRANAINLAASLMKKYNIDIDHVIRHFDVTGKDCPSYYVKNTEAWKKFKSDLKEKTKTKAKKETTSKNNTVKKTTTTTKTKKNTSYKVIVTAGILNVRESASAIAKVQTTIKKGDIYTIIEEKNGWGKLKSGAGWINLKYTKKA